MTKKPNSAGATKLDALIAEFHRCHQALVDAQDAAEVDRDFDWNELSDAYDATVLAVAKYRPMNERELMQKLAFAFHVFEIDVNDGESDKFGGIVMTDYAVAQVRKSAARDVKRFLRAKASDAALRKAA